MVNSCKINIREFGPIQKGTDGRFIDIPKYTFLVGAQGSGKSSLAKLISEFSWLEKALVRGEVRTTDLIRKNRFKNYYCAYHRISSYFRTETEIAYEGEYYRFLFGNDAFQVEKKDIEYFDLPKILYIPAERNVIGIMEKSGMAKFFPESLRTFWEEYEEACTQVKNDLILPVDEVRFTYDRLNKISWINGPSFHTRLSESASGFQSLVPLFVVSNYLEEIVKKDLSRPDIEPAIRAKIQKAVDEIMKNPKLIDEVQKAALENLSSRFRYSHFINIVEEPELNLYPVSQRNLLQELVRLTNELPGNRLVVTTHSPYILSALNNLLYAGQVGSRQKNEVSKIIPSMYWLSSGQTMAYTMDNGCIESIMNEDLQQIEAERIDGISVALNEQYEQLLDIDVAHENYG